MAQENNSRTPTPPYPLLPALEQPRTRYRISDAVFAQLSESIRNLSLPPGTPISEPAIASLLKVSRSPVREAFTRLVNFGLVTVIPQVGSHVAPISMREVEEAVFIRTALEVSAFQRAITADEIDVTTMQQVVDANRAAAAAGDMEAFFETDEELHQQLFVLAGLPHIWDIVRGAKIQLDRLRRLNLDTALNRPELLQEHQSIVDALREKDEEGGIAVIRKHSSQIFNTVDDYRAIHPTYFAP